MRTSLILASLLLLLLRNATAQSAFVPSSERVEGWVVYKDVQGGRYFRPNSVQKDGRVFNAPMLLDAMPLVENYMTAEEEQAMLDVDFLKRKNMATAERDRLIAQILQSEASRRRAQALKYASRARRAVVNYSAVCVPEVPFAEDTAWREHITCWDLPAKKE